MLHKVFFHRMHHGDDGSYKNFPTQTTSYSGPHHQYRLIIDGILLGMSLVGFVCPDSCSIIDCSILKSTDSGSIGFFKPDEHNVDLNMVTRNCF